MFDETGLSKERIKSLQIVIYAISFGTVCFNIINGIAKVGYLKALGFSDFSVGLLLAITPTASALQIFTSYLMERTRNRKAFFIVGGLMHRLVWLPFGLIPFFVPVSAPVLRLWLVALVVLTAAVGHQFLNVSYFSLLADIIPLPIRGSFLGMRGRISTIVGIIGGFMTAWLLDLFPGFYGYAFVFTLATVLGSIDILMFLAAEFPPLPEAERQDSIHSMIKEALRNKQFLGIVGFFAFWNFSLHLSNPFYLVYIRTTLGMSNTTITMIAQIIPNICSVIMITRWGRSFDKRGTRNVMCDISRWSNLASLMWVIITPGPFAVVLIAVAYLSTGLFVPGMEIGSQNIILSRAPQRNRSMYMALYFCMTTLAGQALGNTVGGWLLDNPLLSLEQVGISLFGVVLNRYNYLFFITFILRGINAFLLLPRMISAEETNMGEIESKEAIAENARVEK